MPPIIAPHLTLEKSQVPACRSICTGKWWGQDSQPPLGCSHLCSFAQGPGMKFFFVFGKWHRASWNPCAPVKRTSVSTCISQRSEGRGSVPAAKHTACPWQAPGDSYGPLTSDLSGSSMPTHIQIHYSLSLCWIIPFLCYIPSEKGIHLDGLSLKYSYRKEAEERNSLVFGRSIDCSPTCPHSAPCRWLMASFGSQACLHVGDLWLLCLRHGGQLQ